MRDHKGKAVAGRTPDFHVLDGTVKQKGHQDASAHSLSAQPQSSGPSRAVRRERPWPLGGQEGGPGPSLRMCRDPIGTSLRSCLEPFVIARDYVLPDIGQTAINPEPQMTNKIHFPPDALAAILDQAPGLRDYPIRLPGHRPRQSKPRLKSAFSPQSCLFQPIGCVAGGAASPFAVGASAGNGDAWRASQRSPLVDPGCGAFSRGTVARSCCEMARAASTVRLLISSF